MAKASKQSMTATMWMRENWRPLAAFIYLVINVFDFLIAPVFMGLLTNETTAQFVQSIHGLDPSVQAILAQRPSSGWQPLTLMGSGMFHISFGAILGVSAWDRTREKSNNLREQAYNNAMNQLYPKANGGYDDQSWGGQNYGGQSYGGQNYGGQNYGPGYGSYNPQQNGSPGAGRPGNTSSPEVPEGE